MKHSGHNIPVLNLLKMFTVFSTSKVFKSEQIQSTLKVIFQNNVMRFEGGFMGAVNGMRADGTVRSPKNCTVYL